MTGPAEDIPLDVPLEIRKVASVVATARRLLAEGRMVDLGAVEDKVRLICEAVHAAPPPEPAPVLAAMRAVIEDLDRLADDLRRRFGAALAGEDTPPATQVTAAYRRTRDDV